MNRTLRIILAWGFIFSCFAAAGPQKNIPEEKTSHFKKWLEEDVAYIITEEERAVFKKLTTDEEREHFIEQFWERRNPDPLISENSFKAEHYRRIAYADDHFTSGKAGWKTDRGRIYILFGKPDEITRNPAGQIHNRDLNEGGGHTTTFPYETWFYRKIEGIGSGIEIEFVDASMSGEYRMALSPEEKDAMLYATGTGNTMLEELGFETREDRIRGGGIKNVSGTMYRWGELNKVFDRYQRFFQIRRPPEILYKDLQQLVSTRIGYSLLPMDMSINYLQAGTRMFLAPVTISIPGSALTYREGSDGVPRARVEIYGVVQSLAGRIVYEFEDTIRHERPAGQAAGRVSRRCLYQRSIPLMPGRFKLSLVAKDTASGNISVLDQSIHVPAPPEKGLSASSLLVGDSIKPAGGGESLIDPFVLEGNLKLYPNVTGTIRNGTSFAGYVEFYNLAVDARTLKPDWEAEISLYREGERVLLPEDSLGKLYPMFKADKLALCWLQTMKVPEPGRYELKARLTDRISGESLTAGTWLTVSK